MNVTSSVSRPRIWNYAVARNQLNHVSKNLPHQIDNIITIKLMCCQIDTCDCMCLLPVFTSQEEFATIVCVPVSITIDSSLHYIPQAHMSLTPIYIYI